jgi:hypothetical protein
MDLLLLGTGMGLVGGLIPSSLHLIALTQVALKRWARALFVLVGAPLVVDGALLVAIFFFYQLVPRTIATTAAYAGGAILILYGAYSLRERQRKGQDQAAESATMTYASVSVALMGQLTAPGTWIYWLTLAGPLLAEGRAKGYWHVVPFFMGSVVGFYGAAIFSVWLIAWGANRHRHLRNNLFLVANVLLIILGASYITRAYLKG